MGMSPLEFINYPCYNILDVKSSFTGSDLCMEHNLQQNISEFFNEMFVTIAKKGASQRVIENKNQAHLEGALDDQSFEFGRKLLNSSRSIKLEEERLKMRRALYLTFMCLTFVTILAGLLIYYKPWA